VSVVARESSAKREEREAFIYTRTADGSVGNDGGGGGGGGGGGDG